jgi:alkanesulfonate monooxygenase SsuD/methylene tetrahydromethanopterin reductase-like flavin-dependent oxidoreductase (luciferase family)
LSSGRFILGIGAGWNKPEYLSYGYDYPAASVRIGALEEAVQIIRKMWTEDMVYFNGKYYKLNGAYCNPKPNPKPPIMIGGGGEKLTLRVVASQADWWNEGLPLEEYTHKLTILRNHCERVGRDYDSIKKTWLGCVAIAKTKEAALQTVKGNPFAASETTLTGTPEQISERIKELADLGVEHFILRFLDFPNQTGIEQFMEVIDRFK